MQTISVPSPSVKYTQIENFHHLPRKHWGFPRKNIFSKFLYLCLIFSMKIEPHKKLKHICCAHISISQKSKYRKPQVFGGYSHFYDLSPFQFLLHQPHTLPHPAFCFDQNSFCPTLIICVTSYYQSFSSMQGLREIQY